MIKLDFKKDIKLIILCFIVFGCCCVKYFIPALNVLQYGFLVIHVCLMMSAKDDELIPMLMFNHTCSSLYDDIGFKYIFNLTIMIFTIKIIVMKIAKLNKSLFTLFGILMLYEIILTTINVGISSQSLNLITFFSSYLLVILIISMKEKEFIDLDLIYKYFFWGFTVSALSGYMYPISKWGSQIPIAYRFKGLLRDSNYYSVDALLLIISSMIRERRITKEALIIFLIGILAVSKMYIVVALLSFFLMLFLQVIHIQNRKQIIGGMIILLSMPILIYNINKIAFFNEIINKYLYRTDSVSLLTGREYIQGFYFKTLFNDPITLIFGRSTSYANVLNIGYDINDSFYYNIVAHNTYLDIILSWGIIGTIVYLTFICKVMIIYKKNYFPNKRYTYLFWILIGLCLFALSYLMLDFFAILILYIIVFSLNRGEKKHDC